MKNWRERLSQYNITKLQPFISKLRKDWKKELLNWSGPVTLLIAYRLISTGTVSNGYFYQLLNVLGSVLIITSLWKDRGERASLIVFNVFWIYVAVEAIFKF